MPRNTKNSSRGRRSSTNDHNSKARKKSRTSTSNTKKQHEKQVEYAKKAAKEKARYTQKDADSDDETYVEEEEMEETQQTSNRKERSSHGSSTGGRKSTGESDDEMDDVHPGSSTSNNVDREKDDADLKGVVDKQKAQLQKLENELKLARNRETFTDGSSPWYTKKKGESHYSYVRLRISDVCITNSGACWLLTRVLLLPHL